MPPARQLHRVRATRGRSRAFLVADPPLLGEILSNTDRTRPSSLWALPGPKGSAQNAMRQNYLTAQGAEHSQLAAATIPALSRRSVTGYFPSMAAIATAEVEKWPVGQAIDLYGLVRSMGREVSFRLLFGEPDGARSAALVAKLERYHAQNWSIGAFMFPFDFPATPYRALLRMAEEVSADLGHWVEERAGAGKFGDLRAAHAAMTDADGKPVGQQHHAANFSFLTFASFETMSSALTWALYLLALHPGVLADLADEISAAGPVTGLARDQLNALPLLDAVVKESLRLIPPTPVLIWRMHGHGWMLGGWPITERNRQARLFMAVHVTHRLPEIYAEPDRFRPERWHSSRPAPFAYLPFSGGPRRCPGAMFGTDFLKVGLASIIPRYRLAIGDGTRIDYVFRGITMPRGNARVALVRQDRTRQTPRISGHLRRLVALD